MMLTMKQIAIGLSVAIAAVGFSTASSASEKKSSRVVLVPAPVYLGVTPHYRSYGHRKVVRHGAYYYAQHLVVPSPSVEDDWDEAYDDSDEDEFDLADRDHDGFISLREARRAYADWARDFRKIDASGDGYLTREEVEAFYRR